MNESSDTKTCPMCAETIKAAAKLCPYCLTRQRRFEFLRGELAGALLVFCLIVMVIAVLQWRFPDEREVESLRSFTLHRGDLSVKRSSLESAGNKSDLWLSGYITNMGKRSWRVHELEVRLVDSKSNLVDVQHHDFAKAEAFVVEPGHEHAFRIGLDTRANTNANMIPVVRVQNASNGRERYDPD